MLTVKHVLVSGEEFVYPTSVANFVPIKANTIDCRPPSLWIEPFGTRFELITGMAYVMNDQGRTVAKYDLGGWPEPQTAGPVAA